MSLPALMLLVVIAWLLTGITLALVLGRRGHDRFNWLVLGTVLGPLAVALAVDSWWWREERRAEVLAPTGPAHTWNDVDVLVGFDGSPESRAALRQAIELLGPRLGRLTLAAVVPYECGREVEAAARQTLELEHRSLEVDGLGAELHRGPTARVLADQATAGRYDVLAIGARGRGRAHMFGSVAAELSRTSPVPLLVCGAAPRGPLHDDADGRRAPVDATAVRDRRR